MEPLSLSELKAKQEDAWLFGWDTTPSIVSVWADRNGQALVWQRAADKVHCTTDHFRPWLFTSTLYDLRHLGPALILVSNPPSLDFAHKVPFSYQELPGPPNSFRYLLSASDGRALEREMLKGAKRRLNKEIATINELNEYYRVGPTEQYLMATGRVYFRYLTSR